MVLAIASAAAVVATMRMEAPVVGAGFVATVGNAGGASKHLKAQAASSAAVVSTVLAAPFLINSGPLGLVVLGASPTPANQSDVTYTFDCWKPVLHENSQSPSNGKLLRDVILDPRIKRLVVNRQSSEIVLENIWDEQFLIEFMFLATGQRAAHASLLN